MDYNENQHDIRDVGTDIEVEVPLDTIVDDPAEDGPLEEDTETDDVVIEPSIRLAVDHGRPHILLAGGEPVFLAGYYEEPDDADTKWPSFNWYLDRVAAGGCNVIRLSFSNVNNPYNDYEPWHRTDGSPDCSRPNEDYYDHWLRPVCSNARDMGVYAVLCLYSAEDDWDCINKDQSTRQLTYDKILEYTYDLENVIIEVNWEMEIISDSFMREQARYIQNHPDYPDVLAIITDWHHGDGSHLGPNRINGRHRDWDRETSLWYWDQDRPTLWTERWFRFPGDSGQDPMTLKEARVHLYAEALFCGTGIMFYYTRWNAPAEPDLPQSYLDQCGYAVGLSQRLPLASMTPQERLGRVYADRGSWLIDPGNCYAGYLERGGEVGVNLTEVTGTIGYEWFNPVDGTTHERDSVDGGETRSFHAPDTNDWVLLICREE